MNLFLVFALLFSDSSSARGAKNFPDLKTIAETDFYRLTCSDTASESHVHTYAEVYKGKLKALSIVIAHPALTLRVFEYSNEDLKGMSVGLTASLLTISGLRPGAYFNEDFQLKVKDGQAGLTASLEYDEGDGLYLSRSMKCGAVNYLFSPRK